MDTQKTTMADISAFNTNLLLPKTKTDRSLGAKPVTLAPNQPDSFTPQQQTAKKTQTPQPKKEEEKSWLLPVAVGTGILALVGLVAVCSNTEIREKLLPFLKKKTEGTVDTASERLAGKGNPPPPPDDFSNPPPPPPNGENDLFPNLTIPPANEDILHQLVVTHPEVKAFLAIEQEILALQATPVTDANKADVTRQILAVGKKLTDYHNNSTVLTDGILDSDQQIALTTRREAVTQALKQQLDYVSKLNPSSGQTSLEIAQETVIKPTNPPISSIVPRVEDPPIAPTAGETPKNELWTLVIRHITNDTSLAHWARSGGLPSPDFTTADFYHFQEQCLTGLNKPEVTFNNGRSFGLFSELPKRIKYYLATGGAFSVSDNILEQLIHTGVERGLSSEDNHLALAYAYYNHALLLCAAGAEDSVVRRAFKHCEKLLEPLHSLPIDSNYRAFYEKENGPFIYDLVKEYSERYMGTDAHLTIRALPTKESTVGLFEFPVFQSEVAHHNLKQATETLKTHLTEAQKAKKMNPLLEQAEAYYQGIIDNPEMGNRWHGHAGMAEVLALKSKLAKGEDAQMLKQQAQEQLKLAKERSRETEQAIRDQQKLSYKYGNTLPSSQEYRISKLLQ
ncbi:MAG: hypothetical protein H2174_02090 [Vampirovibrio sp.]|nr:hypothetical protein [Vampirovibrio sp.]